MKRYSHKKRKKSQRRKKLYALTTGIVATLIFNLHIYINKASESKTAFATLCEVADSTLTTSNEEVYINKAPSTDMSDFANLSELQKAYYAVDKKTGMPADLFDIDKLMSTDVHINKSTTEPKILIFHTHPHEMYADSADISEGVLSAGDLLADILETKYGIKCLHITDTSFDTVDGVLQRDGAYERMEPVITKAIADNPSVEMVIDLHRDGVDENLHLADNINGKPYAKIMFFNGLCRIWENGALIPTEGLENPYTPTNLALSLKMQIALNDKYPTLARRIYLNAYRYSLHMKDKSTLVELGAQTNTKEEIYNSIEVLAEIINETVG